MQGEANAPDWRTVQVYYDLGHTREECMRRFGFSKRAWENAVHRGELTPRPPGTPAVRKTREAVRQGLSQGKTQARIARELGLRKSTVAYHARGLGVRPDDRFNRRYDWEAVQRAHDAGMRARECMRHFGFSPASWSSAVKRGAVVPRDRLIPMEDLLVRGRRTGRGHLKQRLLGAGLKENRCEECGLSDWRGRPIGLELHHKNGDGMDNRLFNLEILRPNCHAQTDTWGGRNNHRRPGSQLKLVKPPKEEAA